MKIESIVQWQVLGRQVQGIAAALLPFKADGRISVEAFQNHLRATHRAGLMNAVNMDTGYVNYLNDAEKGNVLGWTRQALGQGIPFVAGGYIVNPPPAGTLPVFPHPVRPPPSFFGLSIRFPSPPPPR